MAKIKNMGHATVRFNEGTIISGSAGTDTPALVVTGSTVISGSELQPALGVYGNLNGEYVVVIDNDQNTSGHVLKLLTDGNGSGSRVLEMIDGDGDTIFRARADGRFGFGPDGVSSMGAGTFVVGIDNSSHTADIAISQRLQHLGDSDTYIDFEPDTITLAAGGRNFIKIEEASTDKLTINNGGLDIDLKVSGENVANLIRTNAGNDTVNFGINAGLGTDAFFSVSGSIGTGESLSVFGGGVLISGSLSVGDAYNLPRVDGSANQVLKTDGSGTVTWQNESGGGGGGSAKVTYLGYVNLQTTARVVSYDYTNLSGTANNNFKGMIIAPFNGTLDTVIVSTKGVNVDDSNTGNVTVYAYKNQNNFASSTDVTVAHDGFSQKASGTPNIYSGIFDFSLSVSQGDLIQLKIGKTSGSNTDSIVTVVFAES